MINVHDVGIGEVISELGAWAPQELEVMRPYMRGIVIDAGGGVGTHALEFAKTADHVFSFEPHPVCFYSMCANLLLNHVYNVTPVRVALGDATGYIAGEVLDPRQFTSTGGPALGFGDWRYRIVRLDSQNIHPVSFAKIDVEGMEIQVLKGMEHTLATDSPVLWVEFHSEELLQEGHAYLQTQGYAPVGTQIVTHKQGDPSVILCQSRLYMKEAAA